MTQEQFWPHGRKGCEARDGGNRPGSHLVTKHQGDDLQHVEAPLLLRGRAGQEEEQVVQATEVQRPEKPVVDAGVIVDPLSGERRGGKGALGQFSRPAWGFFSSLLDQGAPHPGRSEDRTAEKGAAHPDRA